MSKRVERYYMGWGDGVPHPSYRHGLYGFPFGYDPEKPKVRTRKEADEWPDGWVEVMGEEKEKEEIPFDKGVFLFLAVCLIGIALFGG